MVRPVTHTAEVAVNRESIMLACRLSAVAMGRLSSAVTTAMMPAKTTTARRAGVKRAALARRLRRFQRSRSARSRGVSGLPAVWGAVEGEEEGSAGAVVLVAVVVLVEAVAVVEERRRLAKVGIGACQCRGPEARFPRSPPGGGESVCPRGRCEGGTGTFLPGGPDGGKPRALLP